VVVKSRHARVAHTVRASSVEHILLLLLLGATMRLARSQSMLRVLVADLDEQQQLM
jgi:hypothetical protein